MADLSANVIRKGLRLHEQGKLRPVEAESFWVSGDSGEYLVTVLDRASLLASAPETGELPSTVSCSCPSQTRVCSHVIAAVALLREQRDGDTYADLPNLMEQGA